MLRSFFALFAPYKLYVTYCGSHYTHIAHSRKDVLEWMECYPLDALIVVAGRSNIVAMRAESGTLSK